MGTQAAAPTLFDLPNSPDEFAVLLPPANLRRLNFSALDFTTARRAAIEYIRTYFPNDFNDFVASSGVIIVTEILAALVGKLSLRADILAAEGLFPLCVTEEALVNHLALINQRIRRQTPAIVDIQFTVDNPVASNIEIPAGLKLTTSGPDGADVVYEVYRAPGDFRSTIIIPAGKRGVIAYGLEGQFVSPTVFVSGGGPNQLVTINDATMLEEPIFVEVATGDTVEDWLPISDPIERHGPTDKVCEVTYLGTKTTFRFGDDVHGMAPLSGQTVSISYRTGGGIRGRVGTGQLSLVQQVTPLPPVSAAVPVSISNINPSVGGTDKESLTQAKRRAPRDFATHQSIVTAGDYAQAASTFAHPVFGSVAKSVATVRTSYKTNLVEIYVLAVGADGTLVTPPLGLKTAMATYFSDLNVMTDTVSILDGAVLPVDVDATIIVNRNANASTVKDKVEAAITAFFDMANWDMGQPLYLSNLLEAIQAVDGVSHVDMYKPTSNITAAGDQGDPAAPTIGFNELIVGGNRQTRYYYERAKNDYR